MEMTNINNIPKEKLVFAKKTDIGHDSKFDTKPVSYFQGAFKRFSKNKGAVVGGIIIMFLVLFAMIAPFFTPFSPSYSDQIYAHVTPKNKLLEKTGIDFWDGYQEKEVGYMGYLKDFALASEIKQDIIKNGEYTKNEDGSLYTYRFDTYRGVGFGKYKIISEEEYLDIQRYQNETGRQVIYPTVYYYDRPEMEKNKYDANIYYKVENPKKATLRPLLDEDGQIIPNYWKYEAGTEGDYGTLPEYNSLRIEGEDGFVERVKVAVEGSDMLVEKDVTFYYAYGRKVDGGIEVRAEYYEYYTYLHTQVKQDGIEEPHFIFGTTANGKDIFACLAYGARFSFIFAIVVAASNFIVGVIWGSISGYFGGRTDLFMERITDILGAVPSMIVITLLKYHMGSSSQTLVLFISFFATGWIGMAHLTRMQFYRFKNQEYVLAARTLGATDRRVMFKHVFPNGLGTIVTSCALIIPSMIYSETSLSYLGIINLEAGNITSVGTLIAAGQTSIVANAAYVAFFPCMFLCLLMLSFNLFGNGLRDAFNPSLRGAED